ncbi:MAG: helix-turn-helix domain-containing protein [Solirubrobacteraceae bacterium]
MTSAGVAAGIDLCLHIVRGELGEEHAIRIARRMVVAPHRDGGQAQYLRRPLPACGAGLTDTCAWALERLAEPITVADLAGHAGWAPRSFARRFVAETGTTPLRWLTAQRLIQARRLLESTDLSIEDVAGRSGLGTAANLRLHLARDADTSPTAYRRVYRGRSANAPDQSYAEP